MPDAGCSAPTVTLSEIRRSAENDLEVPEPVKREVRRSMRAWRAFNHARPRILRRYELAEDPTSKTGWVYRDPVPD